MKDFVDYAILYSKIIVSELGLSCQEKTLKPIAIGGIAGGSKWYAIALRIAKLIL